MQISIFSENWTRWRQPVSTREHGLFSRGRLAEVREEKVNSSPGDEKKIRFEKVFLSYRLTTAKGYGKDASWDQCAVQWVRRKDKFPQEIN